MKKSIFFTIIGCICLLNFSCSSSEQVHDTYYTYINSTSSVITIECYYGDAWVDEVVNPDELYKTITLPPGESDTVHLTSDVFCRPFHWLNGLPYLLMVGSINSIFYFLHKTAEPLNCLEKDNLA